MSKFAVIKETNDKPEAVRSPQNQFFLKSIKKVL